MASRGGIKAIVQLLLDTGKVDPNEEDDRGNTALHYATRLGYKAIVQLLLETGKVDPNAATNPNATSPNPHRRPEPEASA